MSWASVPPPPGIQRASYGYTQTTTAYTPVQVRQGFSQPYSIQPQYQPYAAPANFPQLQPDPSAYPQQQQPVGSQQQQKIDWPESVRLYVQRSFETKNLLPDVTRAEMETKLKETITYAKDAGIMYTTDWDQMPLPQRLVQAERQQALMGAMGASTMTNAGAVIPATAPANPKKRKSSDLSEPDQSAPMAAASPWRNTKGLSLQDRTSKPSNGKPAKMDEPLPAKSKSQKLAEKRQRRFDGGYQSSYRSPSPPPSDGPIAGTSTVLEKRYLRLTSAPKASNVRPEYILHQTLDLLKKKWRKESNYGYICDQFKSLRQDLTVQRIRNDFTVSVYEIHARIALEKGDLGEYNQCQTQLRALYASGLKGSPIEFKAYRILYFIHTANRTALNDAIADLTTAEKEERAIKHALNVRSALALGNYHKFFQLYLDVPNMGAYLMDMFVRRERLAALCAMCKAYIKTLKLRYITEELAFESDAEAAQFIIDHNGQDALEERDGTIVLTVGKAKQHFELARKEAFRSVDLKGQI
ncbi:GANP/Nin1/mts3/eIF-3 p25 family protein [Pseudomassariella vexata]|uniref:GANP/Nin1/mts3/eIF-3 p25 family protein n=1 Tax=Pseudomassariella vexata TaxID=1141098 RepID=A0A1Y2E0T0_9PEZI|nr:GANP/Nin1/mts3/eIF-3 p25 family protein [Pseudomassariella vexata]ORY65161.1 GANP/Nin1/mts3/eIF-3 p25 family protein [Pseudomassariella vexata]